MMVELQVMQLEDEHTTKYQNKLRSVVLQNGRKKGVRAEGRGPRNRNFILKLSSLIITQVSFIITSRWVSSNCNFESSD